MGLFSSDADRLTEANNKGQADAADNTWYINCIGNSMLMPADEQEAYWAGHDNAEGNK